VIREKGPLATRRAEHTTTATTLIVFFLSAYYLGSIFQVGRRTFWTRGLGDWIDPYFINFLLEHWYHSLTTFTDPASPPMFFPIRGALGYSHGLVLYAPFYFLLRPFFHPFQSYGLMLFTVLEIGTVSLYVALRLVLRLPFVEALLLSAFFLTSPNVMSGVMGVWSQRGSVFLIPPILLLVFVSQRTSTAAPRAVLAALSGLLSTLLFAQDFYTAALALLVALLGFLPLVVIARPPVAAELTARRWLVPFAVGTAAGILIFIWLYLAAYREHPAFSENQVMSELVLRESFDWRRPVDLIRGLAAYDSIRTFTFVLVLAVLTWIPAFKADRTARRCALWFLAFSLLVFVIPIRFGDFSIWTTFFRPVPGLAAIRDPKRIIYLYELAAVLATGLFLARIPRNSGLRVSAALLLFVLLIAEPNRVAFDFLRPNETYERWVAAPIEANPACRSFFITRASEAYVRRMNADSTMYDIDSMFVALNRSIPTLNGYSAWTPEGWHLGNPSDPDYEREVERWIDRYDLSGVCRFDIERRTMRPRP
jgi:hypothetical protein